MYLNNDTPERILASISSGKIASLASIDTLSQPLYFLGVDASVGTFARWLRCDGYWYYQRPAQCYQLKE